MLCKFKQLLSSHFKLLGRGFLLLQEIFENVLINVTSYFGVDAAASWE